METADAADPLYRVICRELADSIAGGELPPGSKLPNGDDLARRYGTSVNTVTRAMRLLTERGLVRRVPGLGSFVAHAGQERSRVFAFIGPCWRGLAELCALGRLETEFRRRLTGSGDAFKGVAWMNEADELRTHEFLRGVRAEGLAQGVFFIPPEGGLPRTGRCLEELRRLQRAGVAVVLLDRDVVEPPDRSEFDVVCLNNAHAGFVVGRHLAERGARRVLFAIRDALPCVVQRRLEGVRAGLETGGSSPAPELRVVRVAAENVRDVVSEFRADALVGKDDAIAAVLMQAVYELHLRIPDDVVVAGFDDSQVAAEMVVPLTSFNQPIGELVEAALVLMRSRLDSPQRPARCVEINGSLSVRRSTRADSSD